MTPIYGDMLLSFPEQFISVTAFDMDPLPNNGWSDPYNVRPWKGILQNSYSTVTNKNGNLAQEKVEQFWTRNQLPDGSFMTFRSITYRLVAQNDWPDQGGFWKYTISRLMGTTSSTVTAQDWNIGGTAT